MKTTRRSKTTVLIIAGLIGLPPILAGSWLYVRADVQLGIGESVRQAPGKPIELVSPFRTVDLSNGLVAYYPFNGNANDLSGNSNHGTVNSATLTNDRSGNPNSAYYFDGVDDYILVPDSTTLDLTTHATFSIWINVSDSIDYNVYDHPHIFAKGPTYGDLWSDYGFSINQNESAFEISNNLNQTEFISFPPLPESVWTHVVFVFDNSTLTMYQNCVQVEQKTSTRTMFRTSSQPLYIGHRYATIDAGRFKGALDEFRIYNRALSPAEIQDLCNDPFSQGKIVFTRPQPTANGSVDSNIWIMDGHGSNQVQLTTFAGEDRWPALSPDGSKIAYISRQDNRHTLGVMDSDGTDPLQFSVDGNSRKPAWSPGGSQIAFANDSEDGWEIWVINADGSNPRRLTAHGAPVGNPAWSADGQSIVYDVEPASLNSDLYVVKRSGADPNLLVSSSAGSSNQYPAWSPDGLQIATSHWPSGSTGSRNLWLMNADGSGGSTLVTGIEPSVQSLSWWMDDEWLIFGKGGQIWRVRRDGTGLSQITSNGGWEPSTSPRPIACTLQPQAVDIILVIDRSGSMANDNRLNDAKLAVTTFLSSTNAPPDQVGLVSFNDIATLNQPLTTTKATVNASAQALTATGSTRIDTGLLQARLELTSTRHITTHSKIIILLTDGLQNDPPGNPAVIVEANTAKAEGATIFTIGLGPDVDAALLQQVATSPGHYYYAPTSSQLVDIYQQISTAIACSDIGGEVYVDRNNNGQYNPGVDAPVPNVRLKLNGSVRSNALSTSQTNGNYRFPANPAGIYTITLDTTSLSADYQPLDSTVRSVSLGSADDLDNHFRLRRIWHNHLPVVTRNYCSGPITDDFSNPASGWPISESSLWSYGYLNGAYRMYAKASAFGAVSRSERPTGSFILEVDARRASLLGHSLGIVLGISDDWSEFYTFEVYPDRQLGVIWHNLNGVWIPLDFSTSGAIQIGIGTNRLRIETSASTGYSANFYINGALIGSAEFSYTPTTARRVGLTASAEAAGFDARFDNYKLVLAGCPENYTIGAGQAIGTLSPSFESPRLKEWDE